MPVLAKLPGLLEHIDAYAVDELQLYPVVQEDRGFIGATDHPRTPRTAEILGAACQFTRTTRWSP